MIRVLNVMGSLQLGGLETTVMHHYRAIDRSKVQFDFLLCENEKTYYDEEAKSLGANIYHRPHRVDSLWGNLKAMETVLKAHPEIDIVHCHGAYPVMGLDALVAKRCNVKARFVHSRSAMPQKPAQTVLFRHLMNTCATHKIACSTEAACALFGAGLVKKNKVILLNNARPLTPFYFDPQTRAQLRKELGIENRKVLVNVGRLNWAKNQKFLLDIFARIHQEMPETVLLLAGEGEEGESLKKKAKALHLHGAVRFLGLWKRVPALLQAADLFLLPSVVEGLPGSAIEAQAAGLPCLLSDTITPECKITNLVEFLPIDQGIEPWAASIAAMCGSTVQNRKNMANELSASGYDIVAAAKKLEELYISSLKKDGK